MRLALGLFLLSSALAIATAESFPVSCGSLLKLRAESTSHRIHSHQVNYGTGSGQQSVTGFDGENDANDYWQISSSLSDPPCIPGTPLIDGQRLRLQHMTTRCWLHSHLHASPLTQQQEVSCFGSDASSDTGDHWLLEIATPSPSSSNAKTWFFDSKVRLKHVDTNAYLGANAQQYPRPIQGQTEIYASKSLRGKDNVFTAIDGVYVAQEGGEGGGHVEL